MHYYAGILTFVEILLLDKQNDQQRKPCHIYVEHTTETKELKYPKKKEEKNRLSKKVR